MDKIYVVTMYRWGDPESHSYVHGVYTNKDLALEMAEEEMQYRGGNKYFPEVLEFIPNTPKSSEEDAVVNVVLELHQRRS